MVMKYQYKTITLGLFLALMFQGCFIPPIPMGKENGGTFVHDGNLSKRGEPAVIAIDDLVNLYYEGVTELANHRMTDLVGKNKYALKFKLFDSSAVSEYGYPVALQPCDLPIPETSIGYFPIYYYRDYSSEGKTREFDAYFEIEQLQELGYLAEGPAEQKALCLFLKHNAYKMDIKSNTLVYTPEEINAVMEEYEQLKQGD